MSDLRLSPRSARSMRATTPIRRCSRIEKAGLLARTWQFACHASASWRNRATTSPSIAGESLFCIRGRDGVIRTFYNVCQHRAHQLVSGEGSPASSSAPTTPGPMN
jgi:hypothetical protein